mmetsp:Transcript_20315/g.26440  ORF Transcript_20315/g.26440 Transcript_20315/m.26440 type:complete len:425 (-) Transcript_20315:159-1433(-)
MQKTYSRDEYLAARARLQQFSKGEKASAESVNTSEQNDIKSNNNESSQKIIYQQSNADKISNIEPEPEVGEKEEHSREVQLLNEVKKHKQTEKECHQIELLILEAEESLEMSIRTAGIRKGRENALLDEIRSLVDLRKDLMCISRKAGETSESSKKTKQEIETIKKILINQRSIQQIEIKKEREKIENECNIKIQEVNEHWKSMIENERNDSLQWRKDQEVIITNKLNDEKKTCREAANSRIATIEDKFNKMVIEVRRGADARVNAAEEMVTYLKKEMLSSKENESELRKIATSHAGGAALATAAEDRANKLADMLNTEKHNSSIKISNYQAKIDELLKQNKSILQEMDHERMKAKENEEDASRRFENELVTLDSRVRKALGSKQLALDKLKKERDEALASAAQSQELLFQIEQGLSSTPPARR